MSQIAKGPKSPTSILVGLKTLNYSRLVPPRGERDKSRFRELASLCNGAKRFFCSADTAFLPRERRVTAGRRSALEPAILVLHLGQTSLPLCSPARSMDCRKSN